MKSTVSLLLTAVLLHSASASAAEIEISALRDIDFGQLPPTAGEQRASTDYCVAIEPRDRYQVIGSGDGPGGRFSLQGTGGFGMASLGYRVYVNDRGGGLGSELLPTVPVTGLRGKPPRADGRCRPPPGHITVIIESSALSNASPGRYRGALTLTVAPE